MQTLTEQLAEALAECKQLAIERVKAADAAVKKDVYAADALMGIATVARRALDRYRNDPETLLREAGQVRREEGEKVRDGGDEFPDGDAWPNTRFHSLQAGQKERDVG